MSRPQAACHPDREHCARGLCRPCYVAWHRHRANARKWEALRRPCKLCGRVFPPSRSNAVYCSRPCSRAADNARRSQDDAEYLFTRDPGTVCEVVSVALGRGCRQVSRSAGGSTEGPYVAAYHQGGGLYVIRVRWPEEGRVAA